MRLQISIYLYSCILAFLFFSTPLRAIESISLISDGNNITNPISGQAIADAMNLLEKACACKVEINNNKAQILLKMPVIDPEQAKEPSFVLNNLPFPVLKYPAHNYTWNSKREGNQLVINLETSSFEGISFGLYGLLQEQLWFQFYHPKQMHIPKMENWPLTESFKWEVSPRFEKKGFHLHTMHPLELTEALLDVDFPNGQQEIRTYIDWLARNQQNYFEFNLLESIDRKKWIAYIKEAVRYGKSRGIIMGIDISLHMTQQKAFKLYENFPKSFATKKKQIEKNIEYLAGAGFDVYNVEFSTTEFTPGNRKKKKKLQIYVGELLKRKGRKLMGREHVVKKEEMFNGKKQKELELTPEQKNVDKRRGLMVHTVMFYSISEEKAPVYRNKNLQHMLDIYKSESKQRETWYYPESAYWITFDNSVPMTLLPYLKARLDDINLMDSLDAQGHVTFSSGWEWGYWLTDWSIARWSWEQKFNGEKMKNEPLQYAAMLVQEEEWLNGMRTAMQLQQKYIKDKELIRYLSPLAFSDEIPAFLYNLELQPRPFYSNKYLAEKALPYQLDTLRKNAVEQLLEFADSCDVMLFDLKKFSDAVTDVELQTLSAEFLRGLQITALRARHRAHTLSYLIEKREAKIKKQPFSDVNEHLKTAEKIREQALELVRRQESLYRYPLTHIAKEFQSKTAYDFGYLFTVSNLHYWKREEEQLRQEKYGPFFMNIMDIGRILGIVD